MNKLQWPIILLTLFLFSCREKASDDSITKPILRHQLEAIKAPQEETVVTQFEAKDEAFKERVLERILEKMDDEQITKLMKKPKFKELLKKLSVASEERVNILITHINEKEKEIFEPLEISVERKIGVQHNGRFAWVDPYVTYNVHSRYKSTSCDNIETTTPYWKAFLKLTKGDGALGMTHSAFEQLTKSCLLYYRLRDNMEKCHYSMALELSQICEIKTEKE